MKEYSLTEYDAEILTRERSLADYFEESVRVSTLQPKSIANYIINKKVNIEETLPAQLVKQIIQSTQTATIDDETLGKIIDEVMAENQKAVSDYKNGKEGVIMFLVGQVIKKIGKKVDTKIVIDTIKKKI